jgi:chromosome segregation ATPase
MKKLTKLLVCIYTPFLEAAPRDANKSDGAVLKLQAMVKSITSERDAAKAEIPKLTAEIEELKKENSKHLAEIKTTTASKEQLDAELNAQKGNTEQVKLRLEQTNTRLLEVIEKYKELQQNKNQLNTELTSTKNELQTTQNKLEVCTKDNVKLIESGRDLMDRYQHKGTVSALLQDEPLLQFNSVEMENIIQNYEDKLRENEYKGTNQ